MNDFNPGLMAVGLLGLITWCVIVVQLVDGWANRQQEQRMYNACLAQLRSMSIQLTEGLQRNNRTLEGMYHHQEVKMLELDARLEGLMDNSRQISSIDLRTMDIVRAIRRIDYLESRLDQLLRNSKGKSQAHGLHSIGIKYKERFFD